METIRLPERIEDLAFCAEINRKVQHDLCVLDWSDVTYVSPAAAAALMRDIDLHAFPDAMGGDTIPDAVSQTLLNAAPTGRSRKKAKTTGDRKGEIAEPVVWRPPSEPPPLDVERAKAPVLENVSPAQLRALLEERVLKDLLGPAGGPEEELDETNVRDRYLVGMLAPRRQRVDLEQQDKLEAGDGGGTDDGAGDATAPDTPTMFPSSMGLSFCVQRGTRIRVTVSFGRYERIKKQDTEGNTSNVWRRIPIKKTLAPITMQPGPLGPLRIDEARPTIVVRGIVNELAGVCVASVFLVNGQEEPDKKRDEAWLFQPEITVEGEEGEPVFLGRSMAAREMGDTLPRDEDRSMALLFRDRVEFAVGHGTSVHAEGSKEDPRRALRIRTNIVPTYEVGVQDARMPPQIRADGAPLEPHEDPALEGLVLDMKLLAEMPAKDLGKALAPMVSAYRLWMEAQRARIGTPEARLEGFEQTAQEALERCSRALERIEGGIALLWANEDAAKAFQFANRAMWQQRVHTLFAEAKRRNEAVQLSSIDVPKNRTWRTFQLAFVLLNLESLTDPTHDERTDPVKAIADLLWFPTGGGKTEAYLGVAAYVMGLRRLQGTVAGRSGEQGIAVLMRYTLRLLTLQQFQRAAALMCACEVIRREAVDQGKPIWGKEPFRIGLWVGAKSTPNKTDHAEEALRRLKSTLGDPRGGQGGLGSPVQLKSCPWCGSTIEPGAHIKVFPFSGGAGRTLMFCGDARGSCPFSERRAPDEGLPVLVVDEEIYRRLPTLLIATVDKFAQMPWRGEVQTLFGQVQGHCPRHGFRSPDLNDSDSHPAAGKQPATKTIETAALRPPDLIIQDELHLISGPLGTLTGLYETAVDELCTWEVNGKRVRPKVIASTATIRRAKEQVHSLFLREVEVFPPQGLDAEDNFFSVQRSPADVPGRRYLGICAPGRRLKAALIRVYVAFLSAAQSLYEESGRRADPWMTLVGYFGSLRELAGMRRLVDDDVRSRVLRMDKRGLARRFMGEPKELTSRLGSTEIPELLDRLEVPFDPTNDDAPKNGKRSVRPIDVLLATNMISVGVDVKRLGLMVCAGQPKTTAEYIQATSRVGRQADKPGLVCTIYNWSRPRDLSHYETFEHYHATFYEHVEALSVTPFAARALDRGLSALLVSLVRLSGLKFNAHAMAGQFDPNDALVQHAIDVIATRAAHVEGDSAMGEEVRTMLRARVEHWRNEATPKPGKARLGYRAKRDGTTRELLKIAGSNALEPFTCLNSLRDVEPMIALLLDDHGLDEDPPVREGGAS